MQPVTPQRIQVAKDFGLHNVDAAAEACRVAGLPFWAACALLQKESGGRNVYGHDRGGALSGFERPVNEGNFEVFRWMVIENGHTSNGVGPCQITYAGPLKDGKRDGGYFRQMDDEGLDPWDPRDNMVKGFGILAGHKARLGTWRKAGAAYNGADSYGADLVVKLNEWRKRLGFRGTVS